MVNSKSFRKKPIKVTHIEKNNTFPEFNFRLNIFLCKKTYSQKRRKDTLFIIKCKVFYDLNCFLMKKEVY
jgi:hypothetical protein